MSPFETGSRRGWIRGMLASLGSMGITCRGIGSDPIVGERSRIDGAIAEENARPGTKDWILQRVRVDPKARYRSPSMEGYASHASIEAGETLDLKWSTAEPCEVDVTIYRMGYYQGLGGRCVHTVTKVPSKPQEEPAYYQPRMARCNWSTTLSIPIPKTWLSGIYLIKLTESREGMQSYIIFVLRDRREVALVYQASDHTWQAYNRWPNQYALYDDGKNEWYWGGDSAVSFDRPYGKYCQILEQPLSLGSGDFLLWEFPFVYWLEQQGWDVSYVSNSDTHARPEIAFRGKGFLSVGHDEYWTMEMYRNAQSAVERGVSLGFFSGNAVCGKVQWNPEQRSLRRVGVFGPPGGTREFDAMQSLTHERPYANELIGAHSTGPVTGGADWICTRPEHWIYEGTGMRSGDRIPGVIGWEWHGDPAQIPGLEIVAEGPTQSAPGNPNGGHYTATIYPGPKGNWVFNAATCWWGDGLSEPPGYVRPQVYTKPLGPDARIQAITRNVLSRFVMKEPIEGGR